MADIRSILALEPIEAEYRGVRLRIDRPTLADLVEALDVQQRAPASGRAWFLYRHLKDADGSPLFDSVEAAERAPAGLAARFVPQIEALYSEGVD